MPLTARSQSILVGLAVVVLFALGVVMATVYADASRKAAHRKVFNDCLVTDVVGNQPVGNQPVGIGRTVYCAHVAR